MDLSSLFQVKAAWSGFQRRHPKFVLFCRAAKPRIAEGTVLEITITPPDGQPLSMNLKVAAQDLEALNQLMKPGRPEPGALTAAPLPPPIRRTAAERTLP